MKYVLCVITMIYAILSMFAAGVQIRTAERKSNSVVMLTGGLFLIAASVLKLCGRAYSWITVIAGGALICISAFINGKKSGNFHVGHHIIRFILTLLLVIGFGKIPS